MNPYKILGLNDNADFKEVVKAYRELAKKYHPDLASNEQEKQEFSEIFQALTNAYNKIKNDIPRQSNVITNELDADYVRYLFSKVEQFLNHNEIDNAINTLNILKKSQKNAYTYLLLARSYKAKEQYKNAIEYFRKAVELENYSTEALIGLAQSYEAIGLKRTAIKYYKEVLEWEPNNKVALEKIYSLERKKSFFKTLINSIRGAKDKETI